MGNDNIHSFNGAWCYLLSESEEAEKSKKIK
jgi:hypothetical protein